MPSRTDARATAASAARPRPCQCLPGAPLWAALLLLMPGAGLAAQSPVTPDALAPLAARIGSFVPWAADDPVLLNEGRNRSAVQKSRELHADFDRSAAFDAAKVRALEEGKPLLWYVPRVLHAAEGFRPGRQMYRPAILDGYAKAVWFSDPGVLEVLKARTVPIRLFADEALGKRFGIAAPQQVEPLLLLIDPKDERVLWKLDRVRTYNAHWLRGTLLEQLQKALPEGANPGEDMAAAGATSEELRAAGHWRVALLKVFAESEPFDSDKPHLLPTMVLKITRQRFPPDLELPVEKLGEQPEERRLEFGRIALLQDRLLDARTALSSIRTPALAVEARFLLAHVAFRVGSNPRAIRHLKLAVEAWQRAKAPRRGSPADPAALAAAEPFAARAAHALLDGRDLTPVGPLLHGFEDPVYRRFGKREALMGSAASERAAREAVAFLLRMQREDGGFTDSRYAYWPTPEITPNVWTAVTALSANALLQWRHLDPERIDTAIAKAEAYAFDPANTVPQVQEEVYADAYRLMLLADLLQHRTGESEQAQLRERAKELVAKLSADQDAPDSATPGSWGHEYPNPFTTGAVVNALARIRARGVPVSETTMSRAAEALLAVRDDDGAYGYNSRRMPRGDLDTRLKNSMARAPLCEASLIWAGHEKADVAALDQSIDRFFTYLPRLEAIRLCDFHTDGELGGFFFWHAMLHTAESLPLASPERHAQDRARLAEHITSIAERDGSFLDSHEMGKSYGTAMALLTLSRLNSGE